MCYQIIDMITVPIRLVGSNSHRYGRVEIYYNGEWGTVCDDGWDTADATVICRQLGFYSAEKAYGSAYYGQGTGPIWLSKLSCIGNESSLLGCGQFDIGAKNCTHSNDAAVECGYNNADGRIKRKFYKSVLICDCLCKNKPSSH